MKGVILAGGTGTRLYPLTKIINKHLLPVGNFPMICHGIEKLRSAGIEEILLVIGKHSAGLYTELLGGGKEWGVRLTYKIQEEAGGIAQALSLAEPIMKPDEKFVVLLGDNLFEDPLTTYVKSFREQAEGARVLLKKVHDPKRYGVPILKENKILMIEEKPAEPKSDFCVTGIYMYDTAVFDKIRSIKPSGRGELEITDVNNVYASEGQLAYDVLDGWWTDAGTFQSLHQASNRLMK
ncbi:NTP transferase domain-containing protein [Paenibacillus sp. N3/727]|uniref:sugar phosphate nucleotidyltransferase n=1 Tax=Paenibacillus sp. N3/727 TaxID=2925845 RepID=UPI001F532585|nr:sugar phosphate nucleotidyltransferase [Paenibacillus sp. N3/727]UNK19764.1 NTP transferase domain-containing protein [Paenibacillus sp. N3/727]